jgi:microcystin degradation protein MlrC
MSALMSYRHKLATEPGVLSVTIGQGFPYADVAEMGMSVVVVTDDDAALASRSARALARQVWDRRSEFDGAAARAEEALRHASEAARGPVLLLDVGDNIGGGAPGDSVYLLRVARRLGISSVLTIIADAAAAAACARAGPGAIVSVAIGGKMSPASTGEPLQAVVRVLAIHDGKYQATGAVHAGMRHFDAGLSAAVQLDTGQTVILMSNVAPPFTAVQITSLGLEPSEFKVIVAKGVHSPVAGYREHVADIVVVDTPGVTSANLSRLKYRHRRRPMFPFEPTTQYP